MQLLSCHTLINGLDELNWIGY